MGAKQKRLARVIVEHEEDQFFVLDPQSKHGRLGPFGVTESARRFAIQASERGVFSFVAVNLDTEKIWMVRVGNERCSFVSKTKKSKQETTKHEPKEDIRPVVMEDGEDEDDAVDMDEI